jgi:hypothetical protein
MAALHSTNATRGSRPYTTMQPVSHSAQVRWPPALAAAGAVAMTVAASGTGKPSFAGSQPSTCTACTKKAGSRMVVSQLSV